MRTESYSLFFESAGSPAAANYNRVNRAPSIITDFGGWFLYIGIPIPILCLRKREAAVFGTLGKKIRGDEKQDSIRLREIRGVLEEEKSASSAWIRGPVACTYAPRARVALCSPLYTCVSCMRINTAGITTKLPCRSSVVGRRSMVGPWWKKKRAVRENAAAAAASPATKRAAAGR